MAKSGGTLKGGGPRGSWDLVTTYSSTHSPAYGLSTGFI